MEPIVGWWYGCPSGKTAAYTSMSALPYGWLSYRWRFSSLTTSRWLSRFFWVTASRRWPCRSASSHSASSRAPVGTVSK